MYDFTQFQCPQNYTKEPRDTNTHVPREIRRLWPVAYGAVRRYKGTQVFGLGSELQTEKALEHRIH